MNNIKYFTGSIAYDYDMFMPAEKKNDNVVEMPKRGEAEARRRKKLAVNTKAMSLGRKLAAAAVTLFILGCLCLNIYLRVQISEVSSSISSLKTQIGELESESTRLSMEIDRRTSYKNLELAAEQLGMRKPMRDQIVYIRTNKTNTARLSDGSLVADNGHADE